MWFTGRGFTSHFHEVSALHYHLKHAYSKRRASGQSLLNFKTLFFEESFTTRNNSRCQSSRTQQAVMSTKTAALVTKSQLEVLLWGGTITARLLICKVLVCEVKFSLNPQSFCCCLQLLSTIVCQ